MRACVLSHLQMTLFVCALVISIRQDVFACLYAIYLVFLLLASASPRLQRYFLWPVFAISISLFILAQYFLLLGLPPTMCYSKFIFIFSYYLFFIVCVCVRACVRACVGLCVSISNRKLRVRSPLRTVTHVFLLLLYLRVVTDIRMCMSEYV